MNAFLLAASIGADLYGEADAALLMRVASFIGPQVTLLVTAAGNGELASKSQLQGPDYLAQAALFLATGTEMGEATRRVSELAAAFIPFDHLRFAIRLSEGDRVVLMEPGEKRPLPDLPLVPVSGTPLGEVLNAERAAAFHVVDGESRLIVPLRVGGRVHGALILGAGTPALLREEHLAPAQQLADILAPHLELLRRAALLPQPFLPGWKRTQRQ